MAHHQNRIKIDQHLQALLTANDTPSLLRVLTRFGSELEFDSLLINAVIDDPFGTRFVGLREIPAGYDDDFEDAPSAATDPVCQHIRLSPVPIAWDQSTYMKSGQGPLWEIMNPFGVRSGIALAFHLPAGEHLSMSFNGPSFKLGTKKQMVAKIAAFQLYSVYALEAARRILFPIAHSLPRNSPRLTNAMNLDHLVRLPEDIFTAEEVERIGLSPREIECLEWHAAGKSLWETGVILSISEETVKKRLMNVRNKMDLSTNIQAAVAASHLGMIQVERPQAHRRVKSVDPLAVVRR